MSISALYVTAEPMAPEPRMPVLDDYIGDFDFKGAELSPTGQFIAGIKTIDGKEYVVTIDLDAPKMELKASNLGDFYVNWLEWTSDEMVVLSVYGYINAYNNEIMTRADIDAYDVNDPRVIPQSFSRMFSLNRMTGETVQMFVGDKKMARNYTLGRITDFLPDDPNYILMPARLRGDLDLFRVNINDGSFDRVATGGRYTYAWYTDRNGQPAFRLDTNRYESLIFVYAREDRKNGKIKWRRIREIRLNRDEVGEIAPEFKILFPGPTATTYYVAARVDGTQSTGIYLYDFESDDFVETVKLLEGVDIEHAIFNRDTRKLLGIYYYEDRLKIEMEDPVIQAHLNGLDSYFGNIANVIPLDASEDGARWLLSVVGPNDPGTYHIYNVDKQSARAVGNKMPSLAGLNHGKVSIIQYQARDGLALKGYLTRPGNLAAGEVPPLVVMPHGGPERRDYYDFDWRAQVLAAHGYQVFQPNFRGSSGYGKAFADSGRREWGGRMQTDVDDGFSYLVSEGLADAERACIYGESYGGYVAMLSAVKQPNLYKCAIAGAGVSDLNEFTEWHLARSGDDSESFEYWRKHIGDPRNEAERLKSISPVHNIGDEVTPLLLIHGEVDRVVRARQSQLMYDALVAADKSVKYVKLSGAGHSSRVGTQEKDEYVEILSFLHKHLPTD